MDLMHMAKSGQIRPSFHYDLAVLLHCEKENSLHHACDGAYEVLFLAGQSMIFSSFICRRMIARRAGPTTSPTSELRDPQSDKSLHVAHLTWMWAVSMVSAAWDAIDGKPSMTAVSGCVTGWGNSMQGPFHKPLYSTAKSIQNQADRLANVPLVCCCNQSWQGVSAALAIPGACSTSFIRKKVQCPEACFAAEMESKRKETSGLWLPTASCTLRRS